MSLSSRNRTRANWRIAGILTVCATCLAVTGCGDGLGRVSGQVTLDGQPIRAGKDGARVTVQFLPVNGVGPNGVGLADEDGIYTIGMGSKFGVPPGDYIVTCYVSEPVQQSAAATSKRIADPKYGNAKTSDLRLSVQAGKNQFDIPLKSVPKMPTRPGA
jgi:hypothetical protein